MSRVLRYSVLAIMLIAGTAMAKKKDKKVQEKDIQIKILTSADIEGITEIEELGEGSTCVKIIKKKTGDDETTCNVYIYGADGLKELSDLDELGDIDITEDGIQITKVIEGEDGFHAIIIHDGETHEFEDKESYEKYLKEHPELEDGLNWINIENCIKIEKEIQKDMEEMGEEIEEIEEEIEKMKKPTEE